jgi:hypothetical protein
MNSCRRGLTTFFSHKYSCPCNCPGRITGVTEPFSILPLHNGTALSRFNLSYISLHVYMCICICIVLFVCCLESLSFWNCQLSGSKSIHEIHCTPSNEHKGYLLYGVDMDLSQSYQHSWWSLSQSWRARKSRLPTLRGPL